MIVFSDGTANPDEIIARYPPASTEAAIIRKLSQSSEIYRYPSEKQLRFEVDLRMSIIKAAVKLNRSRLSFKTFRDAKCNEEFWELTEEGGFKLKEGVQPVNAINDIFTNGHLYGTECATAMVIVFYKALADLYSPEVFNKQFKRIYLMDWQHLDPSLGIDYYRNPADTLPGDCRYFKNPDVNPETPEWQGENVIDMDDGLYYGHGIGIYPPEAIILALNSHRVKDSETSAYLLNSATRPDFRALSENYLPQDQTL